MADIKPIKFTTPAGIAKYPYLVRPDTKYDDDGFFKVDLAFDDGPEIQALITTLEEFRDEFFASLDKKHQKTYGKADVYHMETDDEGDETGRIIIRSKMRAIVRPKGQDPFTQSPILFDCSKPPQKLDNVDPRSGTKMKVSGKAVPYTSAKDKLVGVTLRLAAVQIIELVSGGEDAASYGFDAEDGGFSADATSADFDGDTVTDEDDDF